ncbi:MAG: DUF2238 domain-containing protein [Campylobacterota bacterium]|nr:DUF2238 domain-containing protein [Campylobacterota bacterium]
MLIKYYPHILATLFSIMFVALGINPVDRDVWIVEVIPIVITFLILATTFNKFRFSNYSYTLMALWMFWHTVGGHYTFANVPFDFVTELFDFERNHFDRIGHFVIGFYAFPMAELVVRQKWAGPVLASFFGLFFVVTIATSYEIIEWLYAVTEGGEAGMEFLGSQGDIWDAQKDTLADTLGAIFSLVLFWYIRPDRVKEEN